MAFPGHFFSGAGAPAAFIRRSDFGKDFVFGSATAAFQIEGGLDDGGRGDSIWDTFAKENDLFHPYHEDAVNHYEKFEEDVKLMKEIGFDAYRFSISWPRILPTGKIESRNQEGINYYKKLIMRLRQHGIEPYVTLFHWDLPLALQEEYNGFLDRRVAEDFGVYADVCFKEFSQYVDHWITLNEPFTYAYSAHVDKVHAPGLGTVKDHLFATGTNTEGAPAATTTAATEVSADAAAATNAAEEEEEEEDDGGSFFHPSRSTVHPKQTRNKVMVFKPTESWASEAEFLDPFAYPYIVTHNLLLAHAKAVEVFKKKYQDPAKKKKIGITLVSMWFEPRNPDDEKDKAAALRALDFFIGWYLDPLVHGDYPKSMREYVNPDHLPKMDDADRKAIQGSYDFIGVNYYTARYVGHSEPKGKLKRIGRNYVTDQCLKYYESRTENGVDVPIGKDTGASAWLISYPKGMEGLLLHIKNNYKDPLIYITENGIDDHDDDSSRHWNSFFDEKRVRHIHDHLNYLLEAKRKGVNVKGYFVWSLLDNFEWNNGFHARFGLIYVDYKNDAKRHLKLSAMWLKNFLADK
ncbi:OLC1v1021693C1 [Oldenlandia corymbosa var. corymbosa]|uniref:OLC1v1021693C1 n=1 Tax=Oldenlandia corymbosa var. corymbosa TaxID=529605 RepID=A0AAV1BW77_OLDCO|nr:OLC1v1021693C1 [Oldenlandia corymbosa var. corymbosa]